MSHVYTLLNVLLFSDRAELDITRPVNEKNYEMFHGIMSMFKQPQFSTVNDNEDGCVDVT